MENKIETQYDKDIKSIESMLEGNTYDYIKSVLEQALNRFSMNYKLIKDVDL